MTCRLETLGRIVLVVWDVPQFPDMAKVIAACERAHATTGLPAILLSRVPEDSATPDEQLRKGFVTNMPRLMDHCAAMHGVIEGSGFGATIKRSAVSWITLATGKRRFIFVHATMAAIPATLERDLRREMSEALRTFEARGLIPPAAPRWQAAAGM